MKKIALFCSSSESIDPLYVHEAAIIGDWIGSNSCTLVYGGSARGLMEVAASHVHQSGGKVMGVIPQRFADKHMASSHIDELVVTADMQDRKRSMLQACDAVVVLPGGAGTMDEFFDAYVCRKLGYTQAPIVICNTGGFYDPLLAQLERCYAEHFASPLEAGMYHVAENADMVCRTLYRLFPTLKLQQHGEK